MPLLEGQPDALATSYARSLFDVVNKSGGRDEVERTLGDLEEILELARTNPAFGELLASRLVAADARAGVLRHALGKAVSTPLMNFLLVLNDRGRLAYLPRIVAAFDHTVHEAFGRVEVDMFTAEAVPVSEQEFVRSQLASTLGKDVVLHAYTEGGMLGGVKFRIGDQLIDGSLATQLRRMREQLDTGSSGVRANLDRLVDE